jgi:hypothetical protein
VSVDPAAGVVAFYRTLSPASIADLRAHYTEDAHFVDPFNDVRGHAAIEAIFDEMYRSLIDPRFEVTSVTLGDAEATLIWTMRFRIRRWRPRVERAIAGASHLRFAPDGRVCEHRDYWDAAGGLLAVLPLIGPLVRWVMRRVG